MAYLYKKRNKIAIEEAKRNIKDTIEYCPKCFSEGKEEERYPKSVFYRCNKCNYKWGIPLEIKTTKKKKKKEPEIIVRNKQTKNTSKKEKEKPMVVNTNIEETEKFIMDAKAKEELLEFDYITSTSKREKLVKPYKVDTKNGEKCMLCFCLDDDGVRLYKLEYMHNLKLLKE